MTVGITASAQGDLEHIGDYIAQNNPQRALSFVRELHDKCLALEDMPFGYPLVPRYERYGIRRRAHGNYLIFYRVDANQVTVVHILHGARDYAALLFEDE